MDTLTVWTVIIGLGAGSYGLRFLFLGLIGDRDMPPWVLRHLRYTAVAVLPGLVAPLVLWPPATGGEVDAPRHAAAAVTVAAAALTRSVVMSILMGAGALYLGLYLMG